MRLIALYTVMPANNVNGAEICVICFTNACFFPSVLFLMECSCFFALRKDATRFLQYADL